jgi:hypothetical protein
MYILSLHVLSIHETISTLSTEEAITNGQYMKRQYLHWAQKKLSRMDNTWRDNIYIEHRSYQEWTIHEKTLSTLSTEETIKNGQCIKRHYLHWAQKKLSRMDTWRDTIYIEHRRSYHEWTIHDETISTLSTEEDIKKCAQCRYCLFMYCSFLIASSVLNVDIVSSCIVHSW